VTAPKKKPLVIAHRGASGHLPENTLPAYGLAVEQGADMIEIDLHRCLDGQIVIHHDEALERLGHEGEIADLAFEALRALDVSLGRATPTPMPTLDEVLDAFGAKIPFNLELKRGVKAEYPELEARAVAAVVERGLLSQTLFSSFYPGVLKRLREEQAEARIAVLIDPRFPEGWLERAKAVGAEAVNPHHSLVDSEWVARAHGEGLCVFPYTMDDEAGLRRLLEAGVDGIFTNHPDKLRVIVDG